MNHKQPPEKMKMCDSCRWYDMLIDRCEAGLRIHRPDTKVRTGCEKWEKEL